MSIIEDLENYKIESENELDYFLLKQKVDTKSIEDLKNYVWTLLDEINDNKNSIENLEGELAISLALVDEKDDDYQIICSEIEEIKSTIKIAYTFNVSEHLLTYLINNDHSGLQSLDYRLCNDFMKRYKGSYEVLEDKNFSLCDITNFKSDCVTLNIWQKK